MKTRTTYIVLLFTAMLCSITSEIVAQNNTDTTSKFSINIVKNGSTVTLKCTQGCTWENITLKDDYTLIDSNGIVETKDADRPSSFRFDFKKTATGITLNGIKGTQWSDAITVICENSCKLVVAHYGLSQ